MSEANWLPAADALRRIVTDALRQRGEEGCDVAGLAERIVAAGENPARLIAVYEEISALEPRADFPYVEPSNLAAIRAERPRGAVDVLPPGAIDARVSDRIHGGWLGRCAGCALGKPLEAPPFMQGAANVRRYLEIAGAYPLNDFVPQSDAACRAVGLERLECEASQRGHIASMESDDDLRYTIMGLDVLTRVGAGFTARDVARWWLENLPAAKCFTAEEAAYRNLLWLGATHAAGTLTDAQLTWVRATLNPYREWIGAQIRADGWALACPGRPELAAEFAWRDASLSHVKNGIYGEMFCAAMIAAAAVLDDPVKVVQTGLGQIPVKSRFAEAVRETMAKCEALEFDAGRFEEAIGWLGERFGHYNPVHTINNAAAVVAALLLGARDFERVITIAVMCGWDTDCNGATAGCVCGTMLGAERLPAKWTEPLRDTLWSEIPGYHPIAISELARRHAEVARRLTKGARCP